MKIGMMIGIAAVAAGATFTAAHGADIDIDFKTETGPVKPVHAAGQGPLLRGQAPDFSMFRYLKEAGVPYARLHDVGGMFGQNLWVDIPNIFRLLIQLKMLSIFIE